MKQCGSFSFGLSRLRSPEGYPFTEIPNKVSLWASLDEVLHKFGSRDPKLGTTIRLTAEGLTAEYVSFQWSIEEQRGHFGVLSARNWTRFWTRFFKQPGSRYLIVEEPKRGIRTRRTDKEVALA